MKFIDAINARFILDKKIQNLESIKTNQELEGLIHTLSLIFGSTHFESDEDKDAYFKTAILIFNNLGKPYWKEKKGILNSDYFKHNMNITIDSKESVINQLIELSIKKYTTTIDYNFRGIQFILGKNLHELGEYVIELAVEALNPLIVKAEQRLLNNPNLFELE